MLMDDNCNLGTIECTFIILVDTVPAYMISLQTDPSISLQTITNSIWKTVFYTFEDQFDFIVYSDIHCQKEHPQSIGITKGGMYYCKINQAMHHSQLYRALKEIKFETQTTKKQLKENKILKSQKHELKNKEQSMQQISQKINNNKLNSQTGQKQGNDTNINQRIQQKSNDNKPNSRIGQNGEGDDTNINQRISQIVQNQQRINTKAEDINTSMLEQRPPQFQQFDAQKNVEQKKQCCSCCHII